MNYQFVRDVSKTPCCFLYRAVSLKNKKQVLVKRIRHQGSWDQLLTSSSFVFVSKSPLFPEILEVVKNKKRFQIIFSPPTGSCLSSPESIQHIQIEKFYSIMASLSQALIKLKKFNKNSFVLPQWIFLNKTEVKICHFQTRKVDDKGQTGNDHVFMYHLEQKNSSARDFISRQEEMEEYLSFRNTDPVFIMGVISYMILQNVNPIQATNGNEYMSKVNKLGEICQRVIKKRTKDEKLAVFVAKMVKKTPFDKLELEEVRDYFVRKSSQFKKDKPQEESLDMQLKLQRIKLSRLKQKKRKFQRQCCKTYENQEETIYVPLVNSKHPKMYQENKNRYSALVNQSDRKRSQSLLPNRLFSNRHKVSFSFREAVSKSTLLTKPTAFSSHRVNIKQLSF